MNKTADYELTIIVPVFNEEDNLHRLEERLSAFLPGSSRKACVLFVDDGSKDGSLSGIKDICSRHQDFFYISFEKNAGRERRCFERRSFFITLTVVTNCQRRS